MIKVCASRLELLSGPENHVLKVGTYLRKYVYVCLLCVEYIYIFPLAKDVGMLAWRLGKYSACVLVD